jgi:hypothetical protein
MNKLIGIDPGVVNGYAVYDPIEKKLISVTSGKTWEILSWLETDAALSKGIKVFIEDPTTWKPFKGGKSQSHKLKGAGSVTARFKAILEYLEDNGISYVRVPIQGQIKKVDKEMFLKITGFEGKTNEHGRDAALMVYGRKG